MEPVLIVTLVLVLLTLTSFAIPLLIQLRRTAAALERMAESATSDLKQVAEDVRATRLQVESVAARFMGKSGGGGVGGILGLLQGGALDKLSPLLSCLVGLLSMFLAPKPQPGGSDEQ